MGRYTTAPALLVLLFTTACSGAGNGDASPAASSAVPSSARSSSSGDGAPSPAATRSALDLPADAKILVPVTKGSGNTDLPVFTPETDVYTVYASCTGEGRMAIVDRNAPGDDATKIGCNGPVTVGRVYTDTTVQRLSVQIHGGTANWTLAVVAGGYSV